MITTQPLLPLLSCVLTSRGCVPACVSMWVHICVSVQSVRRWDTENGSRPKEGQGFCGQTGLVPHSWQACPHLKSSERILLPRPSSGTIARASGRAMVCLPSQALGRTLRILAGDAEEVADSVVIRIKIVCDLGEPRFAFSKVSA